MLTVVYVVTDALVSDIKEKRDDRKQPEVVFNACGLLSRAPCGAIV